MPGKTSLKNRISLFWILLGAISWIYPYLIHRGNNYKIFIGVYHHLVSSTNLYIEYPNEYFDTNHYGPLFGVLIAPFALLPYFIGGLFWNIFNSAILLFAIYKLPLEVGKKNTIALLSAISLTQSQFDMQSNSFIAALIILSFVYTLEKKEGLAAFLIILGTMIKLYPIIGVSFFLFSSRKRIFVIWLLIWGSILTVLPMLFSSFSFLISSYTAWFHSLSDKNKLNLESTSQNYSIMGLFMRIFQTRSISNTPFLIFGMIVMGMNLLAFKKSNTDGARNSDSLKYKLYILSSALLMVVLLSTGSESQTYIIAVVGCFIWLVLQEEPFRGFNLFLTLFLLVFVGLAPTDIFPKKARDLLLTDYVIMTWPCIIIWLKIAWELNIEPLIFKMKQERSIS
jgi:hypothetical protein